MDELRAFLAGHARESGDRERYLALEFDQATDCLTLEKYKAFKKRCSPAEWKNFEPKVHDRLDRGRETETLKIRMHRQEYDLARESWRQCGAKGVRPQSQDHVQGPVLARRRSRGGKTLAGIRRKDQKGQSQAPGVPGRIRQGCPGVA